MNFLRIIIFLAVLTPFMSVLSGCYNDAFLDAIHEEEDFISPFDVIINDNDTTRIVYFDISDTGNTTSMREGDDASYTDTPAARSFSERLNANATTGDVVDDNVTALTWTKCTSDNFKSMKTDDNCAGTGVEQTWNDAYTTCDTLVYAGYSDWRLPTVSELFTLLYFGGSSYADTAVFPDTEINPVALPAVHQPAYWTSTSKLFFSSGSFSVTDYGWVVYFKGGGFFNLLITNYVEKLHYDSGSGTTTPGMGFVRCVRGGQ
jgi:hypothetical protein